MQPIRYIDKRKDDLWLESALLLRNKQQYDSLATLATAHLTKVFADIFHPFGRMTGHFARHFLRKYPSPTPELQDEIPDSAKNSLAQVCLEIYGVAFGFLLRFHAG